MLGLNNVYILLGSNIDPKLQYIQDATKKISLRVGEIENTSGIYKSKALGFKSKQLFFNQILKITTSLTVEKVLDICLHIEKELGRIRQVGKKKIMSSRTIDIDIIYFNNDVIDQDNLTVPHPRLHERKFTMLPLCEISPDYVHPIFEKTNEELLARCNDSSDVQMI